MMLACEFKTWIKFGEKWKGRATANILLNLHY
jgi:hypothetical protein